MANPQLENGHTQIANEILEAFCHAFPGGANAQVLLAIIRRTYGWKKKEDAISISQLQGMTGLSRRAVIYVLQNLEAKKFITVKRQRGRGHTNEINTIALQKNHELWVVQRKAPQYENQLRKQREKYHKQVVQRKQGGAKNPEIEAKNSGAGKMGSAKNGKRVVQRNDDTMQIFAPTKETITKEKVTKEKYIKRKYGEFENVLLTDGDYQKLQEEFGGEAQEYIERLSAYMESKGKRYKNHYATILNWKRRDEKEVKSGKAHNSRSLPERHSYTPSPIRDD